LDRKLAKSLSEIIPRFLKDRITNKETAYHQKGQQIKGRQILWMICREFDVNTNLGFMYSIEDLSLMPFTSDKDLQGFLNHWDEISASIQMDKVEPATLANMFQKKLLGSTIMKPDVTIWRRLKNDDPNKTYAYLRDCVETHLRLDKEDKNQDGLQAAHRNLGARGNRQDRWQTAAPGKAEKGGGNGNKGGKTDRGSSKPPGKGGGKGGGKGKGKGKGPSGGKSGNRTPNNDVHPSQIPCRFLYAFGLCNKQADGSCQFAHRAPTAQEIKDYGFYKGDSKGKGAKGKGKSDGKSGKCAQFFASGSCRYGDSCIFSHKGSAPPDKGKGKGKGAGKGGKGKGKKGKRARSAPAVRDDHAHDDWETDPEAWHVEETWLEDDFDWWAAEDPNAYLVDS
jgi:hypothetical protein